MVNERIKQLAEQAHEFAVSIYEKRLETEKSSNVFFYKIKDKKFAELIVAECAGLFPNVYVEIENEYGHTPVIAADYIKKHFGVEL